MELLTIAIAWIVAVVASTVVLRDHLKGKLKIEKTVPENAPMPSDKEDPLQKTLYALKVTSITTRAKKAGTATLRNLWRLNNPFVSASVGLQQAYRQELVRSFTATDGQAWIAVSQTVAAAVKPLISIKSDIDGSQRTICSIRDVSRDVTLAAILNSLFGIDNVPPERLAYIGSEIHRLTVGKKHYDAHSSKPDYLPQDLQRAADRLIDNLRDLFCEAKHSSRLARVLLCSVSGSPDDFNPLNLVIPAFEAPWRAIYYTLLAVLQLGLSKPEYLVTLRDSQPQLQPPLGALAIAYESLRLYPPIRRVRRDSQVDIEAIQRHPKYWGTSASTFDPLRFVHEHKKLKTSLIGPDSAWMPFAVGRMKCPSANGYSVRLMIVIVGEVLRQLFPSGRDLNWSLEGPEWCAGDRDGGTLRAGRDEYGSVRLVVPL